MEQAGRIRPQLSENVLERLTAANQCANFDGHGDSMWVSIEMLRVAIHHEANKHAAPEIAPAGFRRSSAPHLLRQGYMEEMYDFSFQARPLTEKVNQATAPLYEDVLIESIYAVSAQ